VKGICTDIVVNDFFYSDESLFKFLILVYNTFEETINRYLKLHSLKENDIFFTFKGGNILRIVYKELILELPNKVSKNLTDFYKNFFKRSDADFSIYINPKLTNYQHIYDDWCNITYYLQDQIRSIISKDIASFFDYFKYNDDYAAKILYKQFAKC